MSRRGDPVTGMTYQLRITEATGDVVAQGDIATTDQRHAEAVQADNWNSHYAFAPGRYMSELLHDGAVVMTIGGWDEEEEA